VVAVAVVLPVTLVAGVALVVTEVLLLVNRQAAVRPLKVL
jgi:hypothetical protein